MTLKGRVSLMSHRALNSTIWKLKNWDSELKNHEIVIKIQADLVICEDASRPKFAYNEFAYNESNTKPK